MEPVPEQFRIEAIAELHGIATGLFVPFVVARLRGDTDATETTLTVILRAIGDDRETQRSLRLSWSAASIPVQPFGVQDHTVTEWASLGVACVVVWLYAGLRVRTVASPGDRFDFWVTDGEQQYGLEVSGTITEEVEVRHREKVHQLRDNPYGVDGYVVAVSFAARRVIFSFNRFEDEAQ